MGKTLGLLVLVVTASFVFVPTAAAADNFFHYGILGGPNLSTIVWSPEPDAKLSTRIRGNVGAFAEFVLSRNLSLEARGMFVQKGVEAGQVAGIIDGAVFSADYLTFPVLLKVKPDFSNWRPYLAVGPELGLRTGAKAVVYRGSTEDTIGDFEDDIASTDFALDFGGGAEIPAGRVSVVIEGLYSLGLKNTDAARDAGAPQSVKTRTFMINAGLRF